MGFDGVGMWWRKNENLIGLVFVLLLGQLVSFVLSLSSFSSSYLADIVILHLLELSRRFRWHHVVQAPEIVGDFCFPSDMANYAALLIVCLLDLAKNKRLYLYICFGKLTSGLGLVGEFLQVPWYYYVILGFVDVQGNYFVNKAYQYSSITSVTLLDCWTIPWVIILTWFFLGTRYSILQFVGAAICIVGLGLIFLSDADLGDGSGSRPVVGDIFVILGTLFYALSNVGEEYCCKKKDMVEVVCMLGVFGLLVSICQIAVFERENLESIEWSTDVIIGFGGYTLSSFLFYTLSPHVLKLGGAALFNLSLLTSDMWAVLVRIFFYHQEVNWLYYISFALVAVGIVLYSKTSKDPIGKTSDEELNSNGQYHFVGQADENK